MHSAYLNIIKAYDDRREYDKIKNPEPYYLKYTTAILLDKDGNVISRTGTALDFSIETHGNTENIVLPLDIYCTDEQIKQINELDGLYLIDITGYFDKRNFVPQKITFKDASSPNSILLETDFNNEPTGANEIIVAKNVEANIYSKKFTQGSINRPISKTDEKYFKESERLALKNKDEKYRTSSEISHTESNWEIQTTLGGNLYPEFKYWSNSTVFINGEECVLLMGSIGFPRQVATDKLLSVYLTMFIATACVGAMIAHGFVKTVEKEMKEKEHDIFSR